MRGTKYNKAEDLRVAIRAIWTSVILQQCQSLTPFMVLGPDASSNVKGCTATVIFIINLTFCLKHHFLLIL